MKIKLSVSGGPVARYREAEIESAISDSELATLLSAIEIKDESASKRYRQDYFLEVNGKTMRIDIDLVPEQFSDLFKELDKNLKNVQL